jgi:hypothetical protein
VKRKSIEQILADRIDDEGGPLVYQDVRAGTELDGQPKADFGPGARRICSPHIRHSHIISEPDSETA